MMNFGAPQRDASGHFRRVRTTIDNISAVHEMPDTE
jgi:hypothetical protein